MEENKSVNNEEVEQCKIPPEGGKAKLPNNEKQLNNPSTDEPIEHAAEKSTEAEQLQTRN